MESGNRFPSPPLNVHREDEDRASRCGPLVCAHPAVAFRTPTRPLATHTLHATLQARGNESEAGIELLGHFAGIGDDDESVRL